MKKGIGFILVGTMVFIVSGLFWQSWSRKRHFIGKGAEGPTQALTLFADAIENRDYLALREMLDFQVGVCGGMDLMAVDLTDTSAVECSYRDHRSLIDPRPKTQSEKGLDAYAALVQEHILPYRWYMLHYTAYLHRLNLDEYAHCQTIKIHIPRLCYLDWPNHLALDTNRGFNELTLVRRRGRWYVYNFSCQAMGVVIPEEMQPDYAEKPVINDPVLLEMCALGTVTPEL